MAPSGCTILPTTGDWGGPEGAEFDDVRESCTASRKPGQFIYVHPKDAVAKGIETGDLVRVVKTPSMCRPASLRACLRATSFSIHYYRYKLGRGALTKIGESPYKD